MIVVEDLTKYYGPTRAIEGVSFSVDKGEIVGILGLNGAGKTTTLRILACLMLPSGGRVGIDGLDVVDRPHEARRRVGFLPDTPPLYPEMTVETFLEFAARIRGLDKATARRRCAEVLELTGAAEVRTQAIGTLSHGYRQRVGMAQAVVHDPPLLILDEPTSGLDPVQIVEMRTLVRQIGERHTVLVSSHNLPEISQTCDRLLVIQDGRLVASGTEEELMAELAGVQHLRVAARGDGEAIAAAISSVPGVVACARAEQSGGAPYRGAAGELVHHFRVETSGDVRADIARAVVEGGHGLLQLAPAEAELESIFLKLAGAAPGRARAAN